MKNKSFYIPFVLWLIVKTGLFFHLGVVVANDSPRYIRYANHLLKGGKVVLDFDANYILYSLILGFFHKIGLGLGGLVLFQIACTGLSLYFLYKLAIHLFSNEEDAFCTLILYVGWIFSQQWDYYILTDSLFTSFSIFISYTIICYRGRYKEAIVILLICILCTIRPNGFVIGLAFISYLLRLLYLNNKWLFNKVISCLPLLFIVIILYLNSALKSYFPSLIYGNYLEGEIISGYEGFLLNTEEVESPDPNGEPIIEMTKFAFSNPVFVCKMIFYKIFFFFGHIRPYYSQPHNIVIMLVLYPCYVFAIKTLKENSFHSSYKAYLITFILGHAGVVALYMDDWDGRFLLPVIPFVFLLASSQIVKYINRKEKSEVLTSE